jgi:ribosomal protein L29
MNDQIDDDVFFDDVEDTEDARDEVRRLIRGRGARAAVKAAIEVCESKNAPAPAKATAASTLLRAAGLLDAKENDAPKQLHEMTAEELAQEIDKCRQDIVRIRAKEEALDRGDFLPQPRPRKRKVQHDILE